MRQNTWHTEGNAAAKSHANNVGIEAALQRRPANLAVASKRTMPLVKDLRGTNPRCSGEADRDIGERSPNVQTAVAALESEFLSEMGLVSPASLVHPASLSSASSPLGIYTSCCSLKLNVGSTPSERQ